MLSYLSSAQSLRLHPDRGIEHEEGVWDETRLSNDKLNFYGISSSHYNSVLSDTLS